MNGLEQAFYIIAIVFMSVMFILIIALVVSVIMIRNRIVKIQHHIEQRINSVTNIAEKGGELAAAAVSGVAKKAKKAIGKK